MNDRSWVVLSSWIVVVFILLLVTPTTAFKGDFFGIIIFVVLVFALGFALFLIIRDDGTQDMTDIEYEITQLRYEITKLHEKIDKIKRSIEY